VHEFRCYDNSPNAKCQRVLVLALCMVYVVKIEYCTLSQVAFLLGCNRALAVSQKLPNKASVINYFTSLEHISQCASTARVYVEDGAATAVSEVTCTHQR